LAQTHVKAGRRAIVGWAGWVAFFGILLALSRYLHSSQMGFYEDDYTLVTQAMGSTWPQVREFIASLLSSFGGQGRPLQHSLLYLVSWIAGRLGGLPQAYWLGWGVLTLNAVLAWGLMRRLFPPFAALAGGLAFALFGADTTQAFLYHSFGLQQSLTYLLVALHLYLSDRRALAYVLILGSLLSYETAYPVFLAAPLLGWQRGRRLAREFARHASVLAFLFLVVLALRLVTGEMRVAGLGFPEIITVPLLHMLQGPLVTLGTFAYRPLQVLQALDVEMLVFLLAAFAVILAGLWMTKGAGRAAPAELVAALRARSAEGVGEGNRRLLRLLAAGLLMLILAYPLTFTIRAFAISGRDTRVHLAAVMGAALVWASLADVLSGLASSPRKKRLAIVALAAFFALMAGFGLVVQRSYVRAWELQREFWSDVIRLCPDLEDGLVILVEPGGLEDPRFIYANHWNLPRVLAQVLTFPQEWEEPPRVYRLMAGWESNLVTEAGRLRLDSSTVLAPPSLYTEVPSSRAIVLHSDTGRLSRLECALVVGGQSVGIRGLREASWPEFEPGPLYGYLMDDSD